MADNDTKVKRYSILKTARRESLLKQLTQHPEFSGMSVSTIFETLLQIAVQHPDSVSLLQDEIKSLADDQKALRDLKIELFQMLGESLQEISKRLDKIEEQLKIKTEKKNSRYQLDIFEDVD